MARKWQAANPEKYMAHYTVQSAIKRGILTPQPCRVCGDVAQAHHESYERDQWLNVDWLCPKHHAARHLELRDMERLAA